MWARGDIDGIKDVGIPVYARGLTLNSPEKHGPGEIGLPILLGGESVAAGDVVVCDRDGVVVVPLVGLDEPHADFSFWLGTDLQPPEIDFRFAPESRRFRGHRRLPLLTPSRHLGDEVDGHQAYRNPVISVHPD